MYSFAVKEGIHNEKKESMEIPVMGLLADNRLTAYRTMITISAQHAATFWKSIARQQIIYSFVEKETVTIKKYVYGNRINRKKDL